MAIAFYKEQFGLSARVESPEWTEFDVNGHGICLHLADPNEQFSAEGILISNVKDINGVIKTLRSNGVEINDAHEVCPGAFSACFRTPDGHKLSLYEDTNRR
jgi:predicted enzyme related to lactoylglutathione lyase